MRWEMVFMNVAIVGATGYGGLELIRFLGNHPKLKISSLHTSSQFGRNIYEENAHLMHMDFKLEEINAEKIAETIRYCFSSNSIRGIS